MVEGQEIARSNVFLTNHMNQSHVSGATMAARPGEACRQATYPWSSVRYLTINPQFLSRPLKALDIALNT